MLRLIVLGLFVCCASCWANTIPVQSSTGQFLRSVTNNPIDDLQKDPCAQKSDIDASKCLGQKIPDLDPQDTDIKYRCCISWVANDCLASSGKTDCTDPEFQAMRKILDEIIQLGDQGNCKDYPYTKDIQTCKK